MKTLSRGHVLGLFTALACLPACARRAEVIVVGSKDFSEELLLGEIYAQLLEHAGLSVERKLNLGGTQVALEAIRHGDIDLYPEYTGTALLTTLKLAPISDSARMFQTIKSSYEQRYDLTWLRPAPMNDSQALAVTPALARTYGLYTLSDLSRLAPRLRLGAIPEFTKREDGLPGLQRAYGGFAFKSVGLFDIGLKYRALETGNVDVVVSCATDARIRADNLVLLKDDKHFWPAYHVAPVVRRRTLALHPRIASALNAVSPLLTDSEIRGLIYDIDERKKEPADVATSFLRRKGLV
jgi:osmoprotectant transport system substrate-binding protein